MIRKKNLSLIILAIAIIASILLISLAFETSDTFEPSWEIYPNEITFTTQEAIFIEGRVFKLNAELYRNFFPGTSDSSLAVYISIIPQDSLEFPSSINTIKVWIRQGNISMTTPLPRKYYIHWNYLFDAENRYLKIVHGGPKWEINSKVDVFVQVIYQTTTSYYLVDYNQTITRIE